MFSIWRCSLHDICFLLHVVDIHCILLQMDLPEMEILEFLRQIASLNIIIFSVDKLVYRILF
jgi:hypothetical protein